MTKIPVATTKVKGFAPDDDLIFNQTSTATSFADPLLTASANAPASAAASNDAGSGASFGAGGVGFGSGAFGSGGARVFTPVADSIDGTSVGGGGGTTAFLLPYNGALHNAAPFSGNAEIDAALIGSRWGSAGAQNLTFSFPTAANQYQSGYGTQNGGSDFSTNPGGFLAFNAQQQTAARYAMNNLAQFSGLTFTQLTESTTTHATLRFSQTTDTNLGSAHAGFPTAMLQAGDVWMGTQGPQPFYTTPSIGNWGQATIMHELGHAIGLKHGHSTYVNQDLQDDLAAGGVRYGSGALPANHDGQAWSLMTYRSNPGATIDFQGDGFNQPQTYMQDDIAAVQYLYGANYGAGSNNTNSTYSFSTSTGQMFINGFGQGVPSGNIIFRTVWDGGGTDTYDLSNYTTNLSLDLRPGEWLNFGTQIADNRPLSAGFTAAPGNVANALLYNGNTASLIENAIGGIGNDTFRGNVANNVFTGNGGTDTVIFEGNRAVFSFTEGNNFSYTVTGASQGTDTLNSIERFQFNDATVSDDIMGGISTTSSVTVDGAGSTGTAQFAGDRDWFRVNLVAGHNYVIHEQGTPSSHGTLSDPLVSFYNSAGTLLGSNDDGGYGFESELGIRVNTSGTYYIGAGSFSTSVGTYRVSIEEVESTRFEFRDLKFAGFGSTASAGGWSTQDQYPRYVADVNGDGIDDLVGFSSSGVYVSTGIASNVPGGSFNASVLAHPGFGSGNGWATNDTYHRVMQDINGDGRADIVGFGNAGVYVSLNTGGTNYGVGTFELGAFGRDGGWTSDNTYHREVADVTGDGYADIIGFGTGGVYVAAGTAGGHFNAATFVYAGFGIDPSAGGWGTDSQYPRRMIDVNGDGKKDIVGFADDGVYVALATGSGTNATFGPLQLGINSFGSGPAGGGWTNNDLYTRVLGDINGDGRGDIVGFGSSGVYYALGQANGTFGPVVADLTYYGAGGSAGNWYSDNIFPRTLGDIDGNGKDDIVAFASTGVVASRAFDFLTIA